MAHLRATGTLTSMSRARNQHLIFDPDYWGRFGAPHDILRSLRREHPVFWYESDRFDPAWLVTRYKDVEFVGRNPALFLSSPRTVFHNPHGFQSPLRGLPQMDPPEHTAHRRAMQAWFTPRAIRRFEDRMAAIARSLVDEMAESESCEFCSAVGVRLPLRMICEILGIPEDQEQTVLQMTRDIFSASDPELARSNDTRAGVQKALAFCAQLGADRRATPTDDFASTVANATLEEEPLAMQAVASHLMIMISAGHDTTASAINGGMLALIRNPDQLALLKASPELTEAAVNEMLRYVTPTTHFVRTAAEAAEVGGVRIEKDQDICIHFASANRDEAVFDEPDQFRIDRNPNRHLAFGTGPHACIGQLLARIEMKALFAELVPRLDEVSLEADPEYISAFWVTGLKRMPLRYSLS